MPIERYHPSEENLGHPCSFWAIGGMVMACSFPRKELYDRRACKGTVDEVCLFLKDGRQPENLTPENKTEIRKRAYRMYYDSIAGNHSIE